MELVPGGVESRRRVLGILEILNDGTGDPEVANYRVVRQTEGDKAHKGQVKAWPKARGFWRLVAAALDETL